MQRVHVVMLQIEHVVIAMLDNTNLPILLLGLAVLCVMLVLLGKKLLLNVRRQPIVRVVVVMLDNFNLLILLSAQLVSCV